MLSKKLLDILICPISHNPLLMATEEILAVVNRLIRQKNCYTTKGENVKSPIKYALYDSKSLNLYRIENNVPILLIDEAVKLPKTFHEPAPKNKRT